MIWLLASVTVVILLACLTGYRSLILLAAIYGAVVLGWFFWSVQP